MKQHTLEVDPRMTDVVDRLQQAGYETYIVGGAIRDLLLGRRPKDYDISTAATPEQVREVFGRRSIRIIGRRFRLAHLHMGKEIIEIKCQRNLFFYFITIFLHINSFSLYFLQQ